MDRRPTAIIYARVSSAKQAADELPIESQIEMTLKRAFELGATVLQVFRDDGKSGRKSTRSGFQSAIAFCESQTVDFFVTWNSARFARDHLDDGNFRNQLRRAGTDVVEVVDHIDKSNHDAWFFQGMRALINEKYSRDVGRDTKRSLMKNARDGFFNGGRAPIGYRAEADGKRKRLALVEEEAQVVRRMFDLYLAGDGCKRIAMLLNSEGVSKRGAPWSKGNVFLTLTNRRYIGVTVFNRTNHADGTAHPESEWITTKSHAAIIDDEIFERAQTMLNTRAPKIDGSSQRSHRIFTGMLKCGRCDAAMTTETATGRSQTYHYYNCSRHMNKGGCASRRIRADVLDAWLVEQLVETLFTVERIERIMASIAIAAREWATFREQERTRLVAAMRNVEQSQARLFTLLETDATVEASVIAPRLKQHRATLAGLERELIALEVKPDVQPLKMDTPEAAVFLKGMIYNARTPAQVRQFLAGFVREVRIDGEKVTVDFKPEKIVNQPGVQLVHSGKSWLPDQFLLRTGTEKLLLNLPESLRRAA